MRTFSLRPVWQVSAVAVLIAMVGCSGNSAGPDETAGSDAAGSAEFDDQATPPAGSDAARAANTSPFLGGTSQRPAADEVGEKSDEGEKTIADMRPAQKRTSLEGRWDLVLHGFGSNIVAMLIDVTQTEDGFQVEQIGESPLGWAVSTLDVQDNVVDLELADPADRKLSFRGTFRDGEVQGSMMLMSEGLDLASLEPTTRENLGEEPIQEPAPNFDRVAGLQPNENALMNLMQIAEDSGTSPLAYQIYGRLFAIARSQPQQQFDLSPLIERYLAAAQPWGERVTNQVKLDVGYTLALLSRSPEQALEYLDQAAQGFGENPSETIQSRLELSRGLVLLDLPDDAQQQEGLSLLKKVREENPYNILAISRLADFYTKQDELQPALEMHAELVALPSIPGDVATVERLWGELGHNPEDLPAYLDKVYEDFVFQFAEDESDDAPAIENQHVVLGELFTGAACPPCVAADVATTALEVTYPPARLLMLRYHQHIPGPDPLTVADGEDRRDFYEIRGTPSLFLNGSPVQGIGGNFFSSLSVYYSLRNVLTPLLEQTTDLKIDLAAAVEGDGIHLHANVNGAPESPPSWRLRLCLVEDVVHYPAPNGIRVHEMVVRAMPGGPEGITAEDGSLKFEADISVDTIREAIRDGVEAAQKRSQSPLSELADGLGKLHLIAFIQDDDSREILQAAGTPVTGTIVSPPPNETPPDPQSNPENVEPATPDEASPPQE